MSGGCQPHVERDELQRIRPTVCSRKRCCKLKRVRCAKIVHPDGTASDIPDMWRRVDFLPAPAEVS